MTALYYIAGLLAGYFLARVRMSVERHEAECLHRQVMQDIERGRRMMELIERTPIRTQYYSEPKWNQSMQETIEIPDGVIPDGYQAVAFRPPKEGEEFIASNGAILRPAINVDYGSPRLIIKRVPGICGWQWYCYEPERRTNVYRSGCGEEYTIGGELDDNAWIICPNCGGTIQEEPNQ